MCMYMYMYMFMYMYMYVYVYIYTYVCMCVCTYIHTYIHAYPAYIHTCIPFWKASNDRWLTDGPLFKLCVSRSV